MEQTDNLVHKRSDDRSFMIEVGHLSGIVSRSMWVTHGFDFVYRTLQFYYFRVVIDNHCTDLL